MATRTQHARKNIVTSVINKLVIMLANFIMRTALIRFLGEEYLGLDSLFVSVLQILSLTELGVSVAMVFSMYKPLADKDTAAINALLKLYRTVYRWIALAMTVIGLAITPFLPFIIKGDVPDGINVYILYLMNLANTVVSYVLFGYNVLLLTADQKYAINNNIYSIFKVITTIIQIVVIIVLPKKYSYYFYCLVLPLTTVAKNLAIYVVTRRMYPEYKCEGVVPDEEKKNIKKRVAGMFLYKISNVFRNSFDSIVLSAFLGLSVLGKYNSYYYVVNALSGIMVLVTNSVTASVGNSIVTETKEKNFADFNKVQLLFMWMNSWWTVCLVACFQPFMKLWLGEGMMFNDTIMIIFCVYFFTMHLSTISYVYRQAAGLWWQDRFRPIAEAITNLTLNIVLVQLIKVTGVMFSTIFCIIFIDCIWGTRTLFKHYFTEEKQSKYMLKLLLFTLLTAISGAAVYLICNLIGLTGVPAIIVNVIIATVISNVVFAAGSALLLPEFKPSMAFLLKIIGIKKKQS